MADDRTVAVLGTGIMGLPMARHIAGAGLRVRAWNRTREKAQPLAEHGVEIRDEPADAVRGAGLIVTMLSDGPAVAETMERAGDAVERGAVWIQSSTVGLEWCDRLGQLAERLGLAYLDAPVLGTRAPAEQGQLLVLASGDESARERAQPVWDAIGRETRWVGAAGRGSAVKLVMNSWVLALTEATAETLALARALDVPGEQFLSGIRGGPLDSDYAQVKGGMMLERSYDPSFPLAWAAKDARLIQEAAARAGADLPLLRGVAEGLARGVEDQGDKDMAAAYEALAR